MNQQTPDPRILTTIAEFVVTEGGQSHRLYRELVMDHDPVDGSWLICAVDPRAVAPDGEMMGSASIRVKDDTGKQLVEDIIAMLKTTGDEYEGAERL